MKYLICDVRVSELLTKQVSCPPWEVPILEAIHGGGVKVVGSEEIDRDPPSAEDEYRRLSNKYRGNKEDVNSIVAQVYGTFESGIAKVREEMREAGIDVDGREARALRQERLAPVVRSSRMSTGVRKNPQTSREYARNTLDTAGTPGRARNSAMPGPSGIAPSNVDPAPGQRLAQQSKLNRQAQAQGLQQGLGQPRTQSRVRGADQRAMTGDQGLEARKLEARRARERFQGNAQPGFPAASRSPSAQRPR